MQRYSGDVLTLIVDSRCCSLYMYGGNGELHRFDRRQRQMCIRDMARALRAWDPTINFSVSATTRAPRPGEEDGKDYRFVGEENFRQAVAEGEMLEHAHVFGNFYGSPKAPVQAAIDQGQDILFDIDWQGAQQIRNSDLNTHTLSIFLLPPSITELKRRLESRGQDDAETIAKRMGKSWDEISHWDGYDLSLIPI